MEDNKNNHISKRRALALICVVAIIFGIYAVRLFRVQIVEGDYYATLADNKKTLTLPIEAARGEILDSALRPLAVNRTTYEVIIDYNYYPRGTSEEQRDKQNTMLLALTALLRDAGESWNDTLPISGTAPYTFDEERPRSVEALKKNLRMAEYATADNCMAELIKQYHLEAYTPEEQRTLAGIQYEMVLREFGFFTPFTFSDDVSKLTTYAINENNDQFPGVDVQTTAVREYVSGTTAPHLIGLVGPMYAEDYAALKDQGYALNDTLGKSGVEKAFESELRGEAGSRTLIKDGSGNVLEAYESQAPVPGDTVVLTLDSELQDAAQKAIDEKIQELRARPATRGGSFWNNGHDVTSGSVVVLDVKTGGVLACATWPVYDLSTYMAEYETLRNDPDKPLFNRALDGAFAIGSTMKPGMALAALTEGVITPSTTIPCHRTYNYFSSSGLTLHCLGSHGSINAATAITKSCNIFFYEVGRLLGIEKMNAYCTLYGMGQKTGIEIGESAGVLAGPAHSAAVGSVWTPAGTVLAAIGQSDNMITPIQLAAYAMTIANDGVRYKTHLLQALRSYDGATTTAYEPEVAATVEWSQAAIDAVRQGMIGVGKPGGTASAFASASYTIACKTGTAQVSNNRSDHGAFIGYAPVDDPQVAIAVLMENGTSSSSSAVAKKVLDFYFAAQTGSDTLTPEGELLP